MNIDWEQFEEPGSLEQAAVVIKTTGKIFLNEQAFTRLTSTTRQVFDEPNGMKQERHVKPNSALIFYDDKQKVLGFKPTFVFAHSDSPATKFEEHGPHKRPYLPLANFFAAKNINLNKELHLQLEFDDAADIYFIRLPKPGRNTRKPRRKK